MMTAKQKVLSLRKACDYSLRFMRHRDTGKNHIETTTGKCHTGSYYSCTGIFEGLKDSNGVHSLVLDGYVEECLVRLGLDPNSMKAFYKFGFRQPSEQLQIARSIWLTLLLELTYDKDAENLLFPED